MHKVFHREFFFFLIIKTVEINDELGKLAVSTVMNYFEWVRKKC